MILFILIFIVLLLFPIILATYIYKKVRQGSLFIQQNRTRDPRYFGKSFSNMIHRELQNITDGKIHLSKEEEVFLSNGEKFQGDTCEKLVIAQEEIFNAKENMVFFKEVYASQNACFSGNNHIRSAFAEGDMILGYQSQVIRWVDVVGTLAIYDNCQLGISATSAKMMSIGKNCSFRRLYAPVILFGQYPEDITQLMMAKRQMAYRLKVQRNREMNIGYITDDMIDEDGVVPFSVITSRNLTVTDNLIVQGDISSDKGIRLCEGAVVCGNIFAERDIILGPGSCVLGNVFTQGSVIIQNEAVVGRSENISSVIARENIEIEGKAAIFGYAGCEGRGLVCPDDEGPARVKDISFLQCQNVIRKVSFATADEYEGANELGYRRCHTLEEVIIPEGVLEINRSMFYDCVNLKKVTLPSTLQVIQDYAFAGCIRLETVDFRKLGSLQRIGNHAFDGCKSMKKVVLSESIREIGNAAFADCGVLEKFVLLKPDTLEKLGTHVWRGSLLRRQDLNLPVSIMTETEFLFSPEEERQELLDNPPILEASVPFIAATAGYGYLSIAGRYQEEAELTKEEMTEEMISTAGLRRNYLIKGIVAALLLCFLCTAGALYFGDVAKRDEKAELKVEEKTLYHNQGLTADVELSQKPEKITKEYIAYTDRVLKRFHCTKTQRNAWRQAFTSLSSQIPPNVHQTMMIVPLRIQYEQSAAEYRNNMEAIVGQFAESLPKRIKSVDLFTYLKQYQKNYIFYRTDVFWTNEGAYYGARAFVEAKGDSLPALKEYREYMYASFDGALKERIYGLEKLNQSTAAVYEDKNYYYLLPEADNLETVYKVEEDGVLKSKEPLISKARGLLNSYVGGIYSHAMVKGIPENGKSIVLIGDKNADIMASYLLSEYETIYIINPQYYQGKAAGIKKLFAKENIDDVLFVMGAACLGDDDYRGFFLHSLVH